MGDERNIFLSTMPATRRDRMAALAVVGVSAVLFACAVPFAGVPLAPVPAFVASYQSALAINDLITAVLLFSQFAISRSRALLLLASGYLFTAMAAIVHALTFPGLFAPGGLLGAGPQTTVWLYMIWHGGFPLLVLGYALLKASDNGSKIRGSTGAAIVASIVAVSVAMAAFTWLVTAQHDLLPITAERRSLHARHARRGLDGMVPQPRGTGRAVAPQAAFRARRLADGRDVRLAVRHRAVGDPERGALRSRLLSRPHLRPLRRELRARRTADRQCRPAGQAGPPARNVAPASRLRKRTFAPNAKACSARSWNRPTTPSSPNCWTAPSPAGTAPPNACSASRRPKRSARTSTSSSRRTGATRYAISSNGSAAASRSSITRPSRVHKDGRTVDVSLSISPIRSASGEIIGISKTARDITESKRTQQALSQEIEERRRIFETSQRPHPGDRHRGQFHPGQPERHGHPRLSAVRHDRAQRGGIHPPRRSRTHPQGDAGGATRTKQAQFRDALCQQGGQGGRAELDRDVVGAGPPPLLHRPRPDRKAGRGSPVAACAEDGRGRPAHRRRRARLQQHPDRDHRHHRHPGRSRRRSARSSPPSPS